MDAMYVRCYLFAYHCFFVCLLQSIGETAALIAKYRAISLSGASVVGAVASFGDGSLLSRLLGALSHPKHHKRPAINAVNALVALGPTILAKLPQ